ncbi:MAG: hypothetical protein NVS4B11_39290 [Ktedonobacteraceae bacterium]
MLAGGAFDVFYGNAVVLFGFGIGGEGVGMVSCEFGIVDDVLRVATAENEVVRDDGGSLFLATLVGVAQDVGGATMQAGTPCG